MSLQCKLFAIVFEKLLNRPLLAKKFYSKWLVHKSGQTAQKKIPACRNITNWDCSNLTQTSWLFPSFSLEWRAKDEWCFLLHDAILKYHTLSNLLFDTLNRTVNVTVCCSLAEMICIHFQQLSESFSSYHTSCVALHLRWYRCAYITTEEQSQPYSYGFWILTYACYNSLCQLTIPLCGMGLRYIMYCIR